MIQSNVNNIINMATILRRFGDESSINRELNTLNTEQHFASKALEGIKSPQERDKYVESLGKGNQREFDAYKSKYPKVREEAERVRGMINPDPYGFGNQAATQSINNKQTQAKRTNAVISVAMNNKGKGDVE